jgi:AraC-like DNA-binding protein
MPSSRVLLFTDPDSYQATIRGAEVEMFVTTNGKFRAELTQINLHKLWMQRGRETLPRVLHSAVSRQRAPIVFLADAKQTAMQHSGMELSPGAIIVDGLGATHHHRSWGPCRWASMSLTPEELAEAGTVLSGRELTVPSVTHVIRPAPALMGALLSLHENAARLAKAAPARLAHPEVARSLEQALIHLMVRCLTDTPLDIRAGNHRRGAIIARLADLVVANPDRPLYLTDICVAIGVSERTLRACCHEHLGMGPIHYLWLRRMHLARAALIRADPGSASVTSVATDHGFWELGRFSVQYRTLFGESPSASLQRPPDRRCANPSHLFIPEIRNLRGAYRATSS